MTYLWCECSYRRLEEKEEEEKKEEEEFVVDSTSVEGMFSIPPLP